jgi:WD40 repeat protein
VQVWDVKAHKEIASFKGVHIAASVVGLNRDGTRVAAVGWGQARLWEMDSGKELTSFRHHFPVSGWVGAAFSSNLATLAVHNYQEIDLWDTATSKEKATLSEPRGEVGCMVWSDDDKTLIASSTRYDGKDYKWKGGSETGGRGLGQGARHTPGRFCRILAIAPSPDGKTLALMDSPKIYAEFDLKLVDVDTGRQRVLRAPAGCSFLSPRFTTEGNLLVAGASVETLRLWEVSLPKKDVKP